MPKTDGFINRDSKNGEFSAHVSKENNAEDMRSKFNVLKEDSDAE